MWSWDSAQVRAGTRMCVYHGLACARVCVCVCSTRVPVGTWYLASSVTLRDGPGLPSRQSGGDRDRRSSALPARGGLWTLSRPGGTDGIQGLAWNQIERKGPRPVRPPRSRGPARALARPAELRGLRSACSRPETRGSSAIGPRLGGPGQIPGHSSFGSQSSMWISDARASDLNHAGAGCPGSRR